MAAPRRHPTRRAIALASCALLMLGASGCAAQRLRYFPRLVVGTRAEAPAAERRLEAATEAATDPSVVEARIVGDALVYRFHRCPLHLDPERQASIPFAAIGRIRLLSGDQVVVADEARRRSLRLRFDDWSEAARFADLLHSVRYWRRINGPLPPQLGLEEDADARREPALRHED